MKKEQLSNDTGLEQSPMVREVKKKRIIFKLSPFNFI